jgi:RNA polymerase sigma-70 factor (ECF subfamily)
MTEKQRGSGREDGRELGVRTAVDRAARSSSAGPGPGGGASHGVATGDDDAALLTRLRDGDEAAFNQLVDRYYALTLHVVRSYVRTESVAEEVVQDAWIGVIQGLQRFEGRSSLKNWIVRIAINKARTRGAREARSLPFSSQVHADDDGIDPSVFRGPDDAFPGHWTSYPRTWRSLPDEATVMHETLSVVREAIEALPAMQRLVLTLRDVEGWESGEIATTLGLTNSNERILLHRGRTKVRAVLERHLTDG